MAGTIKSEIFKGIIEAAQYANDNIKSSINDLPEYYLSVKVAEHVCTTFKSMTFTMEDSVKKFSLGSGRLYDVEGHDDKFRLTKGKIDLSIRKKTSNKKIAHFIEFKRSLGKNGLIADALRLAWICRYTVAGHRTERNFLAVVSHAERTLFDTRNKQIVKEIKSIFGKRINIKFECKALPGCKSTKKQRFDKQLYVALWQFSYSD